MKGVERGKKLEMRLAGLRTSGKSMSAHLSGKLTRPGAKKKQPKDNDWSKFARTVRNRGRAHGRDGHVPEGKGRILSAHETVQTLRWTRGKVGL